MGRPKLTNNYVKIHFMVGNEKCLMYMSSDIYKKNGWKPLDSLPSGGIVVDEVKWQD